MPQIMPLVRSISLPNLKIYTTISLLLVSGCLYYAFDVVSSDPQWKLHHNTSHHSTLRSASLLKTSNNELLSSLTSSLADPGEKEIAVINRANQPETVFDEATNLNETSSFTSQMKDVITFMTQEPVCIWVSKFSEYNRNKLKQ